jgi:CheY-like chemotaxis protein
LALLRALKRRPAILAHIFADVQSCLTTFGRNNEFISSQPLGHGNLPTFSGGSPIGGFAMKRVLVVDDERDAADTLAMLINAFGYQAQAAYSGRDAIDQVARFLPDMVLMDIGMCGLNGYETGVRIRDLRGTSYVILVAVTGWSREHDKWRAYDCGFDLYVTKPMSAQTLKALLGLLDPSAEVDACDCFSEEELSEFKRLLYSTKAEANVQSDNADHELASRAGRCADGGRNGE